VAEMQTRYGNYGFCIAYNILGSSEDAEECVNDGYLRLWNSIPPKKPEVLCAFWGKIVRNLALNRYKHFTGPKKKKQREKELIKQSLKEGGIGYEFFTAAPTDTSYTVTGGSDRIG